MMGELGKTLSSEDYRIYSSSLLVLELWRQQGYFLKLEMVEFEIESCSGDSSECAEPQMGLEEQVSAEIFFLYPRSVLITFHLFSKYSLSIYCVLESELSIHMTNINHISFLPAGYPPLRVGQTNSDNAVRNGIMGMWGTTLCPDWGHLWRLPGGGDAWTQFWRWERGKWPGREAQTGKEGVAGWDKSKSPS